MKKVLFFISALCMFACSENDKTSSFIDFEEPSISTDSVAFKGRGGFRYIDVQGGGWFVNNIVTEDSLFLFTQEEQDSQKRGDEFVKTCGWLTVKSWTGRIVVYTDANQNSEQRSFKIELCNNSDVVEFIIRKTKRCANFERTAHFFRTKRTSEGYPPFSKIFRLACASII